MERRNIAVPKTHDGEAVARIVHDGLNVPHSTAKGLIDAGCVTINGRPARSHGQRCEGGDVVEVRFDPERRYLPRPQPRHGPGFRVLHEDPEIVVVDKMPGLLSSPAPGRRDESLAELIAESLRSRGIRKPQLFVVHRLDQHTSGLLVFARTARAMEWMAAQFESREAGRTYTAVVQGRVNRDRGTIQSWLVEDPRSLSVRTTPTRGAGKRAITHFVVKERFENATLVRVGLETGRKHQIRVHFAEIGHPVLGDRRYGDPSQVMPRVVLHAERLTFRHPRTLETSIFEAPWPDDLAKLVLRLRRGQAANQRGGEDDEEASTYGAPGHMGTRGGADVPPRTEAPFGRGATGMGPPATWRGPGDRGGSLRGAEYSVARVAVLPAGLTLTDPIGPAASRLEETGTATHATQAGPPASARSPQPPQQAVRPQGAHRAGLTSDRRDRLLRERSVGPHPVPRRAPPVAEAPPPAPAYRHKGAPDPRKGSKHPPSAGGERPAASSRTGAWVAKPQVRDTRPGSRDTGSWSRKATDAREGEKPRGGKPWKDRPQAGSEQERPRADREPRAGQPWKDGAQRRSDRGPGRSNAASPDRGRPWKDKPPAHSDAGRARDIAASPDRGRPWKDRPRTQSDASRSRDVAASPDRGRPWKDRPRTQSDASRSRDVAASPDRGRPWKDRPRAASDASRPRDGAASPDRGRPWKDRPRAQSDPSRARRDEEPREGRPISDRPRRPEQGRAREGEKPRGDRPQGARPFGAKPRGDKPWRGKPGGSGPRAGQGRPVAHGDAKAWKGPQSKGPRDRPKDRDRAGVAAPRVRGSAAGEQAERKPWEFKQKGSTLRRERRRKIQAAQAKGRAKEKKR